MRGAFILYGVFVMNAKPLSYSAMPVVGYENGHIGHIPAKYLRNESGRKLHVIRKRIFGAGARVKVDDTSNCWFL